jgi:hypothetical protein
LPNEFEKVMEDIGKGIAWPFEHTEKVIALLATALKDEPAAKAAIVGLVSMIAKVSADGAAAVAADGINLPEDIATITDAEALWTYIQEKFIPEVKAIYADVDKIVE